jgi:hypothetical protein
MWTVPLGNPTVHIVAYRPEQRSPERPLRERGVMYIKKSQRKQRSGVRSEGSGEESKGTSRGSGSEDPRNMVWSNASFACLVLLVGASVGLRVGGREFAGKGQVAFKPEQSSPERPLRLRGVLYNKVV